MLHGYRGLLKNYSSPAMTRLPTIYCGKAWFKAPSIMSTIYSRGSHLSTLVISMFAAILMGRGLC
jgi:hypothetical protein